MGVRSRTYCQTMPPRSRKRYIEIGDVLRNQGTARLDLVAVTRERRALLGFHEIDFQGVALASSIDAHDRNLFAPSQKPFSPATSPNRHAVSPNQRRARGR